MTQLLRDIYNYDFSACKDSAEFHRAFFALTPGLSELRKACAMLCQQQVTLDGKTIKAAMRISGKGEGQPFAILAMTHGNEPAGLAGVLLALALAEAGQLKRDVIALIGNPLAAQQYFEAWEQAPHARQETRDAYRCGLSDKGELLPDMNRIPLDFLTRDASDHHTLRARDIFAVGQHISGIIDIHSARGNMVCITDHKEDRDLKHSPIRNVLLGLAEAIAANASGTTSVRTWKPILGALPNITAQTGIEAGRHEAPEAPYIAASTTLSLLHTLGLTDVAPLVREEDGIFNAYHVRPRITYADLNYGKDLRAHDQVFMAKTCHALASVPARSDSVIVKQSEDVYAIQTVVDFTRKPAGSMEFALYQYDEMEPIEKDQVVAVAVPSGTVFTAPSDFSGIFVSKSAALYDKDPAVGPWPVHADKIDSVKFCYPCDVAPLKLDI